jgi:type II restriction/modification system DNA methylase subunit YeeA
MTPAEFKKKWHRFTGKESSAYQEHFNDLCRLFGQKTPVEADPSGTDFFCFQKRVVKDAELFALTDDEPGGEKKKGFADVWKKAFFAVEYKGKRKDLAEAYKQLQQYRESLLNPPLLLVCDFDRYILQTNFNGTVPTKYEFLNDTIDEPENWRILRAFFEDPDSLKPSRTLAQVTETLARQIAEVAMSLQKRESVELADATTRKQVNFAQRRNLRIARFLNRIIFCFFAEDSGLLPARLFSEIAKTAVADPKHFASALESLFQVMAKGGLYGSHKIRHFNGHLFEEATVFELNEHELAILAQAAEADWQYIQPAIMGTLFERALEEEQRSQLGAHYTGEDDIRTLVEPVLMAPLRREWEALKPELAPVKKKGKPAKATKEQKDLIASFLKKLSSITVLDPACGSGNFLYVSLQLLLDLEKEVITFATMLDLEFKPQVNVQQLKAIEINPYAYELAQVSVQIGYLQWRRDNGFDNDRTPVLRVLAGFENKDALMHETFRKKPKNLKKAREEEHQMQDELFKVYVERAWPECDVIVGNPPFLGTSKQWDELGREYCEALQSVYRGRVSGAADLCCYWFAKAADAIEEGKCKRAGLLGTQAIRGGVNREVLKHIKEVGDIFFAESDRDWILAGASVHVSMVGFDSGSEKERFLDGKPTEVIHPNLTRHADVTSAQVMSRNHGITFRGTQKSGDFDISDELTLEWLQAPNPNGRPNSDLLKPWLNGSAIVKRMPFVWIVDTGTALTLEDFTFYEKPFEHVLKMVKPQRDKNKREHRRLNWWLHAETCPGMRKALIDSDRFLSTPRVSKHRIFSWAPSIVLPDDGIYIFARSDDYFFGIMHSRMHEVWARSQGTQVRERESGFRYTPNSCFETFPFPYSNDLELGSDRTCAENLAAKNYFLGKEEAPPYKSAAKSAPEHLDVIAAAAKELNDMRERWLNPPELTVTKVLEFPGSLDGPWARYIDKSSLDLRTGNGVVRYPRLEPKDEASAAKLKKRTLTNLYNERPGWLALAHKKLDAAVAAAYGWPADLTDEQILEKLLALNLERAAAEAKATKPKKPKTSRAKTEEEML